MLIATPISTSKTIPDNNIDHPPHYTNSSIEAIDYIKGSMPYEAYIGYLEGAVKKYLHRWRYKGNSIQDLNKAKWYLERLINELSTSAPNTINTEYINDIQHTTLGGTAIGTRTWGETH